MSRFCSLYSSSKGNSTYIGTSSGGILIDAGKSCKCLCESLKNIGVAPSSIQAIFITHEHSDHKTALRLFADKFHTKVYATGGTLASLERSGDLNGDFDTDIMTQDGICVGEMMIKSFKTSHDCAEGCGYTVYMPDGRKISVAMDTGIVTEEMLESVKGSDLILLESNYDGFMLTHGRYPQSLIDRISSDLGHLSNDVCARAAAYFVSTGTTRLILGHLSENNNRPELAFGTTKRALNAMGASEGRDYFLKVAKPRGTPEMLLL